MRILLNLLGGALYVLTILCLAAIVLAHLSRTSVWYKRGGGIVLAREVPASLSAVCAVLLILLLGAGLYFLWRKMGVKLK